MKHHVKEISINSQCSLTDYVRLLPDSNLQGLMLTDQEGGRYYALCRDLRFTDRVYITSDRVLTKHSWRQSVNTCGYEVVTLSVPGMTWEDYYEYTERERYRVEMKEMREDVPAHLLEENQEWRP